MNDIHPKLTAAMKFCFPLSIAPSYKAASTGRAASFLKTLFFLIGDDLKSMKSERKPLNSGVERKTSAARKSRIGSIVSIAEDVFT